MPRGEKKVFQGPGAAQTFRATGLRLLREEAFSEALDQLLKFRTAYPGPQLDAVGVCLWRLGEYRAACEDWAFEIDRYARRETTSADFGAVAIPSLLWWASAHPRLPDRERYHQIAVKALAKRSSISRVKRSPQLSARVAYLLGKADRQLMFDLIKESSQQQHKRSLSLASYMMSEPVSQLPDYATEDMEQSRKWQTHEAHFCIAAKALSVGDIPQYQEHLTRCLENIPPKTAPVESILVPFELERIANGDLR